MALIAAYTALGNTAERIDVSGIPTSVVDLDGWTRADGLPARLRGPSLRAALVQRIRLNDEVRLPSMQLLAGFSGTGKTTVLLQLSDELRQSGHIVLGVDLTKYVELTTEFSFEVLLVALAAGVAEAARVQIGAKVAAAATNFGRRLKEVLGSDVDLGDALDFKVLRVKLRSGAPFSDRLYSALANGQGKILQAVRDLFAELSALLNHAKPVVLVDGLEKISAPVDQTPAAYRQLTDIFVHHGREFGFDQAHLVYVVPPQCLALAPRLEHVQVIPSVRLIRRNVDSGGTESDPDGERALVAVLAKRFGVKALFGDENSLALRALVRASGGHLRTLFKIATEVVGDALSRFDAGASNVLPILEADVNRVVSDWAALRRHTARPLTATLLEIDRRGDAAGLDRIHLDALTQCLDLEHVLTYRNGEIWYAVHPLVASLVAERVRP